MIQNEFDIIFESLCCNWGYVGKTKEDKRAKGTLFYSMFAHLSAKNFEEMVNVIISDTNRKDTFPTISQMKNLERANSFNVETCYCLVCNSTGLVSMLHVFKKPENYGSRYYHPEDKAPDYIRYADIRISSEILADPTLQSLTYAYRCVCQNGQRFGNKAISQDSYQEIKEFREKEEQENKKTNLNHERY